MPKVKPTPSAQRLEALRIGMRGEALATELARSRGWRPHASRQRLAGREADVVCLRELAGERKGLILEVKTSADARADLAARLSRRQQDGLWRMAEALQAHLGLDGVQVAVVWVTLQPEAERVVWVDLEPF